MFVSFLAFRCGVDVRWKKIEGTSAIVSHVVIHLIAQVAIYFMIRRTVFGSTIKRHLSSHCSMMYR